MTIQSNNLERPLSLAVMQPYFLPYLGYFQLMASVESFMIYPYLDFSRKSFVLRNYWVNEGRLVQFHLPVSKVPGGSSIRTLAFDGVESWKEHWFKKCQTQYGRAPHFQETMALLEEFNWDELLPVHKFLADGLAKVALHLGISTDLYVPSEGPVQEVERKVRRIADPSHRRNARVTMLLHLSGTKAYVNAESGRKFYKTEWFTEQAAELGFLRRRWDHCGTLSRERFSEASILHLLMIYGREKVGEWISTSSNVFDVDWTTELL